MDLILVLVDARAKLDSQKKMKLVKSMHEQAQLHIEKKNEQYVTQVNKGSKRLILNSVIRFEFTCKRRDFQPRRNLRCTLEDESFWREREWCDLECLEH